MPLDPRAEIVGFAPMWIFIVFQLSGLRDRRSEVSFMIAIVLATAAILVLHAF